MSITSIFAAMTATAAVAGALPATAATDPAPRSIQVNYADLNLASVADQDRLSARIGRAARAVCGVPSAQLEQRQDTMACRTGAVADAQAQMTVLIAARDTGTQVAQVGGSLTVRAR